MVRVRIKVLMVNIVVHGLKASRMGMVWRKKRVERFMMDTGKMVNLMVKVN
jgi:hypothetical protein